jgi:beta-xylosidase
MHKVKGENKMNHNEFANLTNEYKEIYNRKVGNNFANNDDYTRAAQIENQLNKAGYVQNGKFNWTHKSKLGIR